MKYLAVLLFSSLALMANAENITVNQAEEYALYQQKYRQRGQQGTGR